MNVLFVSSGNSTFGISPIIKSQGDSLTRNGINVDYYTLKGKGIFGYLKNIKPLNLFLKSKKYDVIHAHYSLTGWVAIWANFGRVPVIVSYMGCDTYGDYNQKGRRVLSSYFNILAAKLLQPFVDKIIVKSKNLAKYIYLKKKSETIPNGVDLELFRPLNKEQCRNELTLDSKKKYILFLANPKDPRKNFDLLYRAVLLIGHDNLDIITPYPIKHSMTPCYLNAADVLVSTSFNEGSPNVVKEAMACNTPIVSTDVGDVREIIEKTDGCYLSRFESGDLADKILKAFAIKSGTTGRRDIAHLEESQIAMKIISLYEKVIKKSKDI